MLIIEGQIGEYIDDVIERAISQKPCVIQFNEWKCEVSKYDSEHILRTKYENFKQDERIRYWTPERVAQRDKEIQKQKDQMTKLNDKLSEISTKWELLDWFIECEKISTVNNNVDIEKLIKICDNFNVKPDMNCDSDVNRFNNRSIEYRLDWLLGQSLSCTLSVGCPHGIIHTFVKELKNES